MADDLHEVEETTSKARRMDRRELLKKGAVGAGVAGVVWAAPEIVGLTSAPSYAQAASVPTNTPPPVSNAACTGDASFTIPIPCPPNGHHMQDLVIGSGNCPVQVITADSHWAVGTPHDANASRPTAFNDVHAQDKGPWKTFHAGGNFDTTGAFFGRDKSNPPYLIASIKRANAHCSFTSVTAAAFKGTNEEFFNPVTKQKFSDASVTEADVSIGWASDPNERADLGVPSCDTDTSATLKMHCV